ncbi:CUB and sushi domain-containing protein 1 [Holothuria leucospilota]|uniref:CUB and sushi domain-containing protein 1 n=1 Tax=Holothuria leucospilota TaxID=206669 RepID=A0A9Q1H2W4_HOLLE|nr:CUB and sushi domain-containing protein 1 [Holothuria leucospilota]
MMDALTFISTTKFGFLLFILFLYPYKSVQQVPNERRYIGCFGDDFSRVLKDYTCIRGQDERCPECAGSGLNTLPGNGVACQNSAMTVDLCLAVCLERGHTYAGLQSGNECFCGNENSAYQKLGQEESECDQPCGGNTQQICGGSFYSSVYDLRKSCVIESLDPYLIPSMGIDYNGVSVVFNENDSLTFTCQTGYTLQGQRSATCQGEGSFSPALPTCQPPAVLSDVTCPTLSAPPDGSITPLQPIFRQGESAGFSCRPGFDLVGSDELICGVTGEWNADTPNCTESFCLLPPTVTNANWLLLGETRKVGDSVVVSVGVSALYSCLSGFTSSEPTSGMVCGEDSTWTLRGAPLNCVKDDGSNPGNLPVDEGGGGNNINQTAGVPALLWILIVIVIICLIIFLAGCIIMRTGSSSGPRDYKQRDPYISDGIVVTREGDPGKNQGPNNTAFIVPPPGRHHDPDVGIPAENYSSRATSIASGTLRDNQGFNLTPTEADKYIDSLFDIDGLEENGNPHSDDVIGPYHPTMGGFSAPPPRHPSPHHHPEGDDYPPPPPDPHYHDLERQRLDTPPQQSIYGDEMDLPAHSGPSRSSARSMYLPPAHDYPSVSDPQNTPSPSPSEDKSTQNPEKYFLDEVDEFFDGVNQKIDNCMMQ